MSYNDDNSIDYNNSIDERSLSQSDTISYQHYDDNVMDDDDTTATPTKKNLRSELQKTDSECRTFTTKINRKNVKIQYYVTNQTPGRVIRDAVTGAYCHPHRVGKLDEELYYKVSFTRGNTQNLSRNGETLYYSSPQEYEKHMKVRIPEKDKQLWKDKFNQYIASIS
jgi:hypothetical protein